MHIFQNSLTPTCLDDELGALVARKQSHVHGAAFYISTVLVHNGIQLCVTHWKRGMGKAALITREKSSGKSNDI